VRRLTLLAILLTSLPLSAGWPELEPKQLALRAGDTGSVAAVYHVSGFVWPPYDWNTTYSFRSDASDVLAVSGTFTPQLGRSDLLLRALAPGTAGIHLVGPSGYVFPDALAEVVVSCNEDAHVSAAAPLLTTQPNEPVTLHVIITEPETPLIAWYAGARCGTTSALPEAGPSLTYTPVRPGQYSFCARVSSSCGFADVEFRVDANTTARRRSVRR
jgi:hypothetical protein